MTVTIDSAAAWPGDAMDVEEGIVANWFVRDGATVVEGDVLCEIQVEKVSVDVLAPASGRVTMLVGENDEFMRGEPLAEIAPE